MNFFDKIILFLKKPFPGEESWFGLSKNITIISVFMTLFLYIFQPSGISEAESDKFLICLGFGVTSALAYFIYELIFNQLFKLQKGRPNWTFGKWLLYSIGVLFCISLANFLYIRLLFFGYIQWNLFPYMIKGVFMFGIPVLAMSTFLLLQQEQKYELIADKINQQKANIPTTISTKVSTNDQSIFNIPVNQIKYIEALQNYIVIGYLNEEGQLKKQTERATLKSILQEVEGASIVRTHRSYLVNQQAIVATAGNAQGLLLTLSNCDKEIPVSRSYVAAFR